MFPKDIFVPVSSTVYLMFTLIGIYSVEQKELDKSIQLVFKYQYLFGFQKKILEDEEKENNEEEVQQEEEEEEYKESEEEEDSS